MGTGPLNAAVRRRPDYPGSPDRPGRPSRPAFPSPRRPPGRPAPYRPRRAPAPAPRPVPRPPHHARPLPLQRRSVFVRRLIPWLDFWPQELPLVSAPPLPLGWTGSGVCASPLPQVRAVWTGYQGTCGPWPGYANACLAGQAIAEASWAWTPTANVILRVGRYYDPNIFAWRHQILAAYCYPSPVPRPVPRTSPRPQLRLGVATPGPVRDLLLGRHLPHGREVQSDLRRGRVELFGHIATAIEATRDPSGRVRLRQSPPTPQEVFKPAGPRDRERKDKYRRVAAFVMRALSQYSEARDRVVEVWKALPKRYRRAGKHDTWGQLQDILQHWRYLNMRDAARNLVLNEVEDYIIGRAIGHAKERGLGPYIEAVNWRDSYLTRGVRTSTERGQSSSPRRN